MCPPVRARYAAEWAGPNRPRQLALRWLEWESNRRFNRRAAMGNPPLPPDARILAIQPDHLGGALLTTPAWRLIKEALPTAYLTVLAGPWAADVPEHCPPVDRVRICRFPGFDRATSSSRGGAAGNPVARVQHALTPYGLILDEARALAKEQFHAAIVFHADFWWGAALAALAAIPHRIGYATPDATPFLSRSLPLAALPVGKPDAPAARPHVAEQYVGLAQEILALANRPPHEGFDSAMRYQPTTEERGEAWRIWRTYDLDEAESVVAFHPAPGAPAKRWPPDRFAWVIDHVAGRFGATTVVTGGPNDVDEARAIAAACRRRPVVVAGQTTFGVQAALFDRCRLVVGTDNGALHLASARGVPNFRLFGPTSAASWGAWSGSADTVPAAVLQSPRLCSPCHRLDLPAWEIASLGQGVAYPCMAEMTSDQVISALEALWPLTARRQEQPA